MRLDASDFSSIIESESSKIVVDTIILDFETSQKMLMDHLKETTLTFKFINTIELDYTVDFEFLDDLNNLKYKVHVPISAGSVDDAVTVETIAFIEEPEILNFKSATKLVYKITLQETMNSLSSTAEGKLSLLSKATYFYK